MEFEPMKLVTWVFIENPVHKFGVAELCVLLESHGQESKKA
jgi:hypothetical protein